MTIPQENYSDYIINLVKLKIWYLNWLYNFGVPFEYALNRHLNLYCHTSLCKYPPGTDSTTRKQMTSEDKTWQQIVQKLKNKISTEKKCSAFTDLTVFEEESLALMQPYISEHIAAYLGKQANPKDLPFGCFSYNPATGLEQFINIHFNNVYTPDSPFSHQEELKQTLLALVTDVQTQYPTRKYIQIYSWLAALPKFAELFPAEWVENTIALGPDAGSGCWGQFTDRRGGFNYRMADTLRKTGQFAFAYSRSWCSCESLITHLNQ